MSSISSTSLAKAVESYNGINKTMSSMASGKKSTVSAPASVAISDTLRSLISSGDSANGNAQNAISLLQTSNSYLNAITNDLSMMKKLAVKAQDGTASQDDQASVKAQFETLQNDISSITSNYNAFGTFDSLPLFQGSDYKTQSGPSQSQTTDVKTPDLTKTSEADIGLVNTYTYDSSNVLVGSSHTEVKWGSVIDSVAGLDVTDSNTVGALDKAIDYVAKASSYNNANISSMIDSYSSVETYNANLNSALSLVSSTDMASDSFYLAKEIIMAKSQTAMQAQANSMTNLAMKLALLRG